MAEVKMSLVAPDPLLFEKSGFPLEPAKQQAVSPRGTYFFQGLTYPASYLEDCEGRGLLRRVEDYWLDQKGKVYRSHFASHKDKLGVLAWFQGCPFPAKGMPFPQFIQFSIGPKRILRNFIEVAVSKEMRLSMAGFLLSRNKIVIIEKWLEAYSDFAEQVLSPFFIAEPLYAECSREARIFTSNFLTGLGVDGQKAARFARIIGLLIQGDDAYRIRIEDGASLTSKATLLKNPAKEIRRVIEEMRRRESGFEAAYEPIYGKFDKMTKLLKFFFLIPKAKRAFRDALEKSHFENFQLDDSDRFHNMLRTDYNVLGLPFAERIEIYKIWFSVFPPAPPMTTVQLQQ